MIAALIGDHIGPSLTPQLHEAEGRAQNLNYSYLRIDTALLGIDLPTALKRAKEAGCRGVNVTHPHKQAVLPFLSKLSPAAKKIGAINTIKFNETEAYGENTDHLGFRRSLLQQFGSIADQSVAVFGAGGAGAAVSFALADSGASHLAIMDSDFHRAQSLAELLREAGVSATAEDAPNLSAYDGAANCSPLGMASSPGCVFDPSDLPNHAWVADCVYFPKETELLKRAQSAGLGILHGSGMAVFQAAASFELFTNNVADTARMENCMRVLQENRKPETLQ
jgi:shikimate dehydrogenase